jgi:hypothetical protein
MPLSGGLAQTCTDGPLLLKFPRYFQAIDRNDNISGPKLIRSTSGAEFLKRYELASSRL